MRIILVPVTKLVLLNNHGICLRLVIASNRAVLSLLTYKSQALFKARLRKKDFVKTTFQWPIIYCAKEYKGDVTRNDSQPRFLAQHSVAILEQCCNHSKQCRNNDSTLCCAENRRCESSRVTLP